MRVGFAVLTVSLAAIAQAQTFHPLHVSTGGIIEDDTGKPVALRGVNRSGTGSGNAEATVSDAEYAAQTQLLSANLVRIFVNATWWNNNVQVPIANQKYQDYIDALIQRAKKYGNYVLILKAGQFPDSPCGADGKNCPAPNQGDLNCQSNSAVCSAQDTTGNNIDAAFSFWIAFAKKYATDPALLYDTWENMHGIDANTWSNNENQLIAAIRTYSPQALIFLDDTGTAFEAILAGTTPDLAFANLVWNFHLYNASIAGCTEPSSPRYASWSQNFDPLVSYAQQNGHAVAITEWGGCNDADQYHTNITSYSKIHSIALAYFDSTNLLTSSAGAFQLTTTGLKVAQAYTALAASTPGPNMTLVANAFGDTPLIAPNTWLEIKGTNLAPVSDTRIWQGYDFFTGLMPDQLDGVSVKVNGKTAFVYYVSPTQVNILTPPEAIQGPVQVQLTNAGVAGNTMSVASQPLSLSFFVFVATNGNQYVFGRHLDGTLIGPTSLFPGLTTPAKPGETIVLAGNGFGVTSVPVASGSVVQTGTLPVLPVISIGGATANVQFAGLVSPGDYQFNVVIPTSVANGDQPIQASYGGSTTQTGALITIQR